VTVKKKRVCINTVQFQIITVAFSLVTGDCGRCYANKMDLTVDKNESKYRTIVLFLWAADVIVPVYYGKVGSSLTDVAISPDVFRECFTFIHNLRYV